MLIRGEWDTVCADADAANLGAALGTALKDSVVIEQATHLMHLESQRGLLYNACNAFLSRHSQA
jgi:alpha-beta hydrolase superfamily lysophospholipase